MYIKIERGDKTSMYHAKSYHTNKLKGGLDFNIECVDNIISRHYFENGEGVEVFIMNHEGKTIDRL